MWLHALPVVASVFSSFPSSVIVHTRPTATLDLLAPLLLLLDQLRSTADLSSFVPAIDDAIAASIAHHSAPATLHHLPLLLPTGDLTPAGFTDALSASRAWLLPLIRTHGRGARLEGFWDVIWPEVQAVREAKERWEKAGDAMRVRACELLEEQLWDTFPSFCSWATDVPALKAVAKRMGEWLASDDFHYAHALLCRGLTLLITQNQQVIALHSPAPSYLDADAAEAHRALDAEVVDDDEDEDSSAPAPTPKKTAAPTAVKFPFDPSSVSLETAEGNVAALSLYAKNFLPLLFNLVSRGEQKREVVLECIAAYASISDAATINALFQRALKKLLEANAAAVANSADVADITKAHGLADIVLAMTAALNDENLSFLYRSVSAQLSSDNAISQKKAYKTLAAICSHHADFFGRHWQEILTAVTGATSALLPSAAKVRLACLTSLCLPIPLLVVQHGEDAPTLLGHLPALLGEVLLALKEPSVKTRQAAYTFINEMGAAMRAADERIVREGLQERVPSWGLTSTDSAHPLFGEYLVMLMGGLAGTSPHMQSATVLAFSHLLFSCRGALPGAMVGGLLSTFLPLLQSRSREVQKAMMGLLKVVALSLDADELRVHAKDMVEGLGEWGEDRRHRFQEKVKVVLEILMRKLGADAVKGMVGKDQLRLVEHIRKMKARETKAKADAWAARKEARGAKGDDAMDATKPRRTDFDAVLYGSDKEDEDDGEEEAARRTRKPRRQERSQDGGLSVREGTEDLLGSDMVVNVGKSRASTAAAHADPQGREKRKRRVRENAEGKLLVMEDDALLLDDASQSSEDDADGQQSNVRRKRGREEDEERALPKRRMTAAAGAAYAGRGGAGGDAKRRGQKFDPYAFIPLDASVLNRRKQRATKVRMEAAIGTGKRNAPARGKAAALSAPAAAARRTFSHSKQHKKHKG